MDNLKRMVIFYHVVQTQSFSGAARQLGIARSAVSRHITLLEKNIGVRLLNRTTRRLSITEAGETYFKSCKRIVVEAESATENIAQLQDKPRGNLKIAAPVTVGNKFIAPLARRFMQKYKALNVELLLSEEVTDMVAEGIDISVRVGWLQDSSLIAKKLGEWPMYLCASPGYIEQHGRPESPAALIDHEWVIFTRLPSPHHWTFTRNKRQERIQVKGRLRTNNADAVRSSMIEGAGISTLTAFLVKDDIKSGKLEQLLPNWDCGSVGVYAVYHDRLYQHAKVRMFLDYLAEEFKLLG